MVEKRAPVFDWNLAEIATSLPLEKLPKDKLAEVRGSDRFSQSGGGGKNPARSF